MSKQHKYDFLSLEEIIRSAQQTGLTTQEISDRLGLSSTQLMKWLLELHNYNRRYDYDSSNPPTLEVGQERLDYLADYCRTQGIFPTITHPINHSEENILPHYVPTKNKAAQKICVYANRYVLERKAEPTELDLWELMWTHRKDCGFQMRPSPNGQEIYYLQETQINLRGFKRRLEEYRRI